MKSAITVQLNIENKIHTTLLIDKKLLFM